MPLKSQQVCYAASVKGTYISSLLFSDFLHNHRLRGWKREKKSFSKEKRMKRSYSRIHSAFQDLETRPETNKDQ